MKWIEWPVAEMRPFEFSKMAAGKIAAGRHLGFGRIGVGESNGTGAISG